MKIHKNYSTKEHTCEKEINLMPRSLCSRRDEEATHRQVQHGRCGGAASRSSRSQRPPPPGSSRDSPRPQSLSAASGCVAEHCGGHGPETAAARPCCGLCGSRAGRPGPPPPRPWPSCPVLSCQLLSPSRRDFRILPTFELILSEMVHPNCRICCDWKYTSERLTTAADT